MTSSVQGTKERLSGFQRELGKFSPESRFPKQELNVNFHPTAAQLLQYFCYWNHCLKNLQKEKPKKMKESIPKREGCACADSVEKEELA